MDIFLMLSGLIFWGVGLATLVAIALVLRLGRRSSRKTLGIWLVVVSLPMCLVLGALFFVYSPVDHTDEKTLRDAYTFEFSEYPSADITLLNSRQMEGVSGFAWMSFKASPETIDRIIAPFAPSDAAEFAKASQETDVPKWWKPEPDGVHAYYSKENWSLHHQLSQALIGVNRQTGLVYFYRWGFD